MDRPRPQRWFPAVPRRARAGGPRSRARRAGGLLLVLVAGFGAAGARAEAPAEAGATAPAERIEEIWQRGSDALQAGQIEEADAAFERLLWARPTFAPALVARCRTRLALRDRTEGLRLCREAIARAPDRDALLALADGVLALELQVRRTDEELREGLVAVEMLLREDPEDLPALARRCDLLFARRDGRALREVAAQLAESFPDDPDSLACRGSAHAAAGRVQAAERAFARAVDRGYPAERARRRVTAARSRQPVAARLTGWLVPGLLAWSALWFGLVALAWLFGRASDRRADAVAAGGPPAAVPAVYRGLLAALVGGAWMALAWTAVTGAAAAAWAVEAARSDGPFVVATLLALACGAVGAAGALLAWLGGRPDPRGAETVPRTRHPALWRTVDASLEAAGLPPVDAIELTPGFELALLRRGRLARVGVGLLHALTAAQLSALLAHDAALLAPSGSVARRASRAARDLEQALRARGLAHFWSAPWVLLRAWSVTFAAVSGGARRLQAHLADRQTALSHGGGTLAEGIEQAARESVRWDVVLDGLQADVADTRGRVRLPDVYGYQPQQPPDPGALRRRVEEALDAGGARPPARLRIAHVAGIAGSTPEGAARSAVTLLDDPLGVRRSMTELIRLRMEGATGFRPLP